MSQPINQLSPSARHFVEEVLLLQPQIAVFDCDGTLWQADSGERFFTWEMERGLVSKEVADKLTARYEDYKRGLVGEEDMCGEMVSMNEGVTKSALVREATAMFKEKIVPGIFREMKVLTLALAEQGCELWAISSTNDWVVTEGVRDFGISAQNVIACSLEFDGEVATNRLIRIPSGAGKAVAVREVIRKEPDAVFGNSIHDLAMLELAKHPYAINPNAELLPVAKQRGWPVYQPEKN